MPDHNVLFNQLKQRIIAMVTPHVVQLQSSSCSSGIYIYTFTEFCTNFLSGMKSTWKEILLQLITQAEVKSSPALLHAHVRDPLQFAHA